MRIWMDADDIAAIETLLDAHKNRKGLRILEWGSGGSTVHFTRVLDKLRADYSWFSIEHNTKWCSRVMSELAKKNCNLSRIRVEHVLLEPDPEVYVTAPLSDVEKKGPFDIILVDGRYRRRCLLQAAKLLAPEGMALLHDAERKYYHCAMDAFLHSEFLTSKKNSHHLWVGSFTESHRTIWSKIKG